MHAVVGLMHDRRPTVTPHPVIPSAARATHVHGCRRVSYDFRMGRLVLEAVARGRRHLVLRYAVGDLHFSTTYWYDDVDLFELEERHGDDVMRKLYFHLLAFEANKAGSLAPTEIDAGPYDDLVTDSFWDLWETLFRNVWGVWRLENDLPDYRLPRPPAPATVDRTAPIEVTEGQTKLLMLCGGGKDSLVGMRLLERAGVDYDAFIYSHSTYGRGEPQHRLVDRLVAHCQPRRVHRAWVIDDALDAPVNVVYPELGINRIVAAETVSSYWTALPVALQHGFTEVALGVTRSTDEHNLVWDRTGEEINYLWGMSAAAEQLLHAYVRRELLANVIDVPPVATDLRHQRVFAACVEISTRCRAPTRARSRNHGVVAAPSASTCG